MTVAVLVFWSCAVPSFGETARFREGVLVSGIVERVEGDILTVDRKEFDTKNVPVRFIEGMSPLEKPFLRGKMAQVLVRNGKIHSVLILPVLGQ
jgi:hypothetical protein